MQSYYVFKMCTIDNFGTVMDKIHHYVTCCENGKIGCLCYLFVVFTGAFSRLTVILFLLLVLTLELAGSCGTVLIFAAYVYSSSQPK